MARKRQAARVRAICADAYREPPSRRAPTSSTRPRPRRPSCCSAEERGRAELRGKLFKDLEQDIVRGAILATGQRIDGRDTKTVRPIDLPRSASCRAPMARRCSPAARPRRSSSPRSAPARTSRSSTRSRASTASTSCCTTTSRPMRPARRAAWARPAGARSATASSPGARVHPLLPAKESFPYTIRVVSEITEIERLVVDGLGLRRARCR